MNKTNLKKGIELQEEITELDTQLEIENNRVDIIIKTLGDGTNFEVRIWAGNSDVWALSSKDMLPIYRKKVERLGERIKTLESEFKKL